MNQKEADVRNFLARKGVIAKEKVDEERDKLAANCPEAIKNEKGLSNPWELAYETMQIMEHAGEAAQPIAPTATGGALKAETQPETVSTASLNQIQKQIIAQEDMRIQASNSCSVEKLVKDRPDPDAYIPEGTKGVINTKSWANIMKKIESGEYTVLADDPADQKDAIPSTTNFNLLKDAAANNTQLDVYIGKGSSRPIGYQMKIQNDTGAGMVDKMMTREQALNYVALNTYGYILAQKGKPGLKLRVTSPKNNAAIPGQRILSTPVLVDCNKKDAIQSGAEVVSREVDTAAGTVDTSCKSALCFRVQTNQRKNNGDGFKVRTIRASLTAPLPVLKRKNDFVPVFGTGIRESNADLLEAPSADQLTKICDAQAMAIANIQKKANEAGTMRTYAQYKEQLAAFEVQPAQPPLAGVI